MLGMSRVRRFFDSSKEEISYREEAVSFLPTYSAILKARFLAIGGGKGGVGKSFVATNLGVLLSRLGKKVLIVDADLGAANLHTFLGAEGARLPLSGFLKGENSAIESLIGKTAVPNLDIISGANDALDVADLGGEKIARLRDGLKRVDYDYILLDTGPGTASNLLDLFLMGDDGIIITTVEPTSIENTYRFIKCLVLRKIKKVLDSQEGSGLKDLLKNILNESVQGRSRTIKETFEHLKLLDQLEVKNLVDARDSMKISIIINQVRRQEEKELGHYITMACYDFFGLDINYLGHVGYDESVFESIRLRRPLSIHNSSAAPVKNLESCLHGLINKKIERLMV